MSTGKLSPAVQFIQRIKRASEICALADAELLNHFIDAKDEESFAQLVERHGPMVFGVCRRVLRNPHDAEDAFQATFVVLMNKASSIGRKELLGNWLYGVAYRVSLRAKAKAAKRQEKEWQAADAPHPSRPEFHACDLKDVLDEELGKLADKYRLPLVLFFLQGMTKQKIARVLGWPEGTVSSRLKRGKDQLRVRLSKRGVTATAAVFVATLSQGDAGAAFAAPLIEVTLASLCAFAGNGTAAGAGISNNAAALANSIAQSLSVMRLLRTGVAIVFCCVLIGSASTFLYRAIANQPPVIPADREPLVAVPANSTVSEPPRLTLEIKQGVGRAITLSGKVDNPSKAFPTIDFEGAVSGSVKANADGTFRWETFAVGRGVIRATTRGPKGMVAVGSEVSVIGTEPEIRYFEACYFWDNQWGFSGHVGVSVVPDDKIDIWTQRKQGIELDSDMLVVQFDGPLAIKGKTAKVSSNGKFLLQVTLAPADVGSVVRATTTTCWGYRSNEVSVVIPNSACR